MKSFKKLIVLFLAFLTFTPCFATVEATLKQPDYAKLYLGEDKLENSNRKVFNFNQKLNKYAIRPVHILWSSIFPVYAMDRIQGVYTNIEYPKRLVSTLVQKDFKAAGHETLRFLTNSTLGLGGMFDPAKRILKIEHKNEDMNQALAKCNIKQGSYMCVPILNGTTPRELAGKLLEAPLDAGMYVANPLSAAVKFALFVNKTTYLQPLMKLIEDSYADPYDIQKKIYGLEKYIKIANLDRSEILALALSELKKDVTVADVTVSADKKAAAKLETEEIGKVDIDENTLKGKAYSDNLIIDDMILFGNKLVPDIILKDFNPQNPIVDAMRTALFKAPNVDKSIWNEISLWNRSFFRKLKDDSVVFEEGKSPYYFKYLLQKDKFSPLAIIFPSIGEGVNSSHSASFAKLFYDEGYSVLILGSHFNFNFQKSMKDGYVVGYAPNDAKNLQLLTRKILDKIEDKYEFKFGQKTLLGTSFGAFQTLYVASIENKEKILDINNYIAISPPVELMYALNEVDKNNAQWRLEGENLKDTVAKCASKVVQLLELDDKEKKNLEQLPFSESEGKLLTSFIMQQKLSDLIFTIENGSKSAKTDIYDKIYQISYNDFAMEYLFKKLNIPYEEFVYNSSLYAISDYLKENNNYTIYHSLDDYFVNKNQLASLKTIAKGNLVLLNNGSHLGFLYRKEFQDKLKSQIKNYGEKLAKSLP